MNNDNNLIVKDDINFLEYPIWIAQEKEDLLHILQNE